MNSENTARIHAFVEGRVQGVGFRYFVISRAERYQLKGWVRNRYNDEVELVAEGPRPALDNLLADVRRGPSSAFVSNVRVQWEEPEGRFRSFDVLPTS